MNAQHRPHSRVQGADVGKFALRLSRIGPGLAGRNLVGIEVTGPRGHGMRKRILVDPRDRIANFHRENLGVEASALDRHRARGGCRRIRRGDQGKPDEAQCRGECERAV